MNKDWIRDQWVDANIPDEKTFDKGFVKHLMKQAYDEGKISQENMELSSSVKKSI